MNNKSLIGKYPKIFKQRTLPVTESLMCFGLECSEGWGSLLDLLCSQLQWDIDRNGYPQIEATQVKEKYGSLRFYYSYSEDAITEGKEREVGVQQGMVEFAEQLSAHICEQCGSNQGVFQTQGGWIRTTCQACEDKRAE